MNSNPEELNKNTEPKQGCGRGRHCWKFAIIVPAIILVKSAAVFYLWNALVPELFHGPVIVYVQAIGLLVLAKLLFGGGFRGRGGHFGPGRRYWAALSDEERAKLRDDLRRRCGHSD